MRPGLVYFRRDWPNVTEVIPGLKLIGRPRGRGRGRARHQGELASFYNAEKSALGEEGGLLRASRFPGDTGNLPSLSLQRQVTATVASGGGSHEQPLAAFCRVRQSAARYLPMSFPDGCRCRIAVGLHDRTLGRAAAAVTLQERTAGVRPGERN